MEAFYKLYWCGSPKMGTAKSLGPTKSGCGKPQPRQISHPYFSWGKLWSPFSDISASSECPSALVPLFHRLTFFSFLIILNVANRALFTPSYIFHTSPRAQHGLPALVPLHNWHWLQWLRSKFSTSLSDWPSGSFWIMSHNSQISVWPADQSDLGIMHESLRGSIEWADFYTASTSE